MYVEDDERTGLDGELLSALAALHAPRSSRSGEICGASRNREIEFANFYVAERSRSRGPVVPYASRFSTALDLAPHTQTCLLLLLLLPPSSSSPPSSRSPIARVQRNRRRTDVVVVVVVVVRFLITSRKLARNEFRSRVHATGSRCLPRGTRDEERAASSVSGSTKTRKKGTGCPLGP